MTNNLRAYWDKRIETRKILTAAGIVTVRKVGSRWQIVSPFNEAFRTGIKQLGGRWRYRSFCWSVPGKEPETRAKIIRLITDCYGAEKVPKWMKKKEN